jgi:CRISPR system Cascade subunit CasA
MTHDTPPAFNLLDEPWLPVRTVQGEMLEVSLTAALLQAREYAAIAETSPPNLVALYRLLLALVHRALTTHHGPWRDTDRARWFHQGLPEEPLRAYLTQWRDRFWVFHPQYPFMQVAALAQADETKDKQKPWTQITLEGASGNTPVVFDHSLDDHPKAIAIALACRNLLGFLQFTPGGLVKTFRDADKAGPLSNTAAALPAGKTLSQTLVLALHPWDGQRPHDLPAWELPAPAIAALRAEPSLASGPNDRYSRCSRAVLFLPEEDGKNIQHIRFAAGLGLEEDPNAHDPMACYRINKEGKSIRVSFSEGRAIWRELPALVPDGSGKHNVPAAILGWATNVYTAMGHWDAPIQILTAGLASDQAKLLRWRAEQVELPSSFLMDPDAAANLREQLRRVEEVYASLRGIGAALIAATMPDANHKDTRSRARDILHNGPTAAMFFSSVERQLPPLMQELAQSAVDAAQAEWSRVLAIAVAQAWQVLCKSLGNSPAVLRAQARAQPKVNHLLYTLQPPDTPPTSKENAP